MRLLVLIAILAGVAVAWMCRWEIVVLPGAPVRMFFMVNRWTGEVQVVWEDQRLVVPPIGK